MTGRLATEGGVSRHEQLKAIIEDGTVFALGDLISDNLPDPVLGGRPRDYPTYLAPLWLALITVWRSSRNVETELSNWRTWKFLRKQIKRRFPDQPNMWLPRRAPSRYHYSYTRNRYLVPLCSDVHELVRSEAVEIAHRLGLCDEQGGGSWTHPDLTRCVVGDGKVVKPLYKAKRGATRVDRQTGEVKKRRADPDALLHMTGGGQMAYGNKFEIVATRAPEAHLRVIVDVEHVPNKGGEAAVAVRCLARIVPALGGVQAVIYDGALRGTHVQDILQMGILTISPVTPSTGGHTTDTEAVYVPRRVETATVGSRAVQIYARGGHFGVGELDENGDVVFVPMKRKKTIPRQNRDGTWRWYGEYEIPAECGGDKVLLRADLTDADRATGFNRTEHVRAIPPDDPDYLELYRHRSDIESINRTLDDTLWLGRAHSLGARRQLLDLVGFQIVKNAIAALRHRIAIGRPAEQAA